MAGGERSAAFAGVAALVLIACCVAAPAALGVLLADLLNAADGGSASGC